MLNHHPLTGPCKEGLVTNARDLHQAVLEKGNLLQSTSTGSDYFLNEIRYCPLLYCSDYYGMIGKINRAITVLIINEEKLNG